MPRSELTGAFLALAFSCILISCSPEGNAVFRTETVPEPTIAAEVTQESEDTFKIDTWFDKPDPVHGEQVLLYGSLLKNGVYLNGLMMKATWPDENQERGRPNCDVLVIYQRGVCLIDTGNLKTGEFIPITVKFIYMDASYTDHTGFTLR